MDGPDAAVHVMLRGSAMTAGMYEDGALNASAELAQLRQHSSQPAWPGMHAARQGAVVAAGRDALAPGLV
jgi:hypothetical protein